MSNDGLNFSGSIQPPSVPPDPTGQDWRGPAGPPGPPGADGVDGTPGSGAGASLSGSWDWLTAPQAGSVLNNKVGVNTDNPALATEIRISAIANGGVNYGAFLRALHAGDAINIWDGADSSRWGRWNVTGNAVDNITWFVIPVAAQSGMGGEPNNNADVQVLLLQGGSSTGANFASPPPIGNITPNRSDFTQTIWHGASPGQSLSAAIGNGYYSGGAVVLTDTSSGGAFTGSISGTTLTVTGVSGGTYLAYAIYPIASGIANGTTITGQLSGTTGGVGTYSVNISQSVSSRAMTGYTYATAFNGSAVLNHAGSQGFGLFSQNTLSSTGTVCNEFDVTNNSGVDALSAPFPPGQFFGTTDHVGIGLQLVCNGTNRATVGLQVIGSSPTQNFQRGIYLWPGACNAFGIQVDAGSSDTMTAAAHFRNSATSGGVVLALQAKGTSTPANVMFSCTDDSGAMVAGIFQSGAAQLNFAYPAVDNSGTVGSSSKRYNAVWATTGTIQTSDPSAKNSIRTLASQRFDALDFVAAIDPVSFRWNEAEKRAVPATLEVEVQASRKSVVGGRVQMEYLEETVTETQHTTEWVSEPGRRTHLGFLAPDFKAAFDRLGVDYGLYVQAEDGSHHYRPDQLIPILWRAVQLLTDEVRHLKGER